MSKKLKKSTGGKLLVRSGGLVLSLPIVLFFGGILLLVNSLLAVIILGGLAGLSTVVQPYLGLLSLILLLGVFTMIVLFRGVVRYTGGIGKLWGRLRGIQEERARVERLMEQQHQGTDETLELVDLNDEQQESKI